MPSHCIEIEWPDLPSSVGVLCTTRFGGSSQAPYDDGQGGGGWNLATHVGDLESDVAANRARLRARLPSEPVWLNQVHGTQVVDAAAASLAGPVTADASLCSASGVVCAILTADCMPVLFCDQQGLVVGAAHAGWRGLASGVLEATVRAMRTQGAQQISAWCGPAIGPTQFEVGEDVLAAFALWGQAARSAFVPIPERAGKYWADLPALARLALASIGVSRVYGGDACTASDATRFYSFRRDGRTGRMASLIWKR
jgi:YfiH family protein